MCCYCGWSRRYGWGQAFDLLSEDKHIPLEELKVLHSGKTGALFNASVELGLILGSANNATRTALMEYSNCLGLLFQITDDILDVTGTIEELGKHPVVIFANINLPMYLY